MRRVTKSSGIWLVFAIAGAACTEPEQVAFGTAKLGEACALVSDCEAGLTCTDAKCAALPPIEDGPQRGDACRTDADCSANGLVCGRQQVCTTSHGLPEGSDCGLTENCVDPLICNGNTGKCSTNNGAVGTLDLGVACSELLDCRRPYVCGLNKTCDKLPLYLGPSCTRADSDAGKFRAHFELPATADASDDGDFYRHPFPSDLRRKDGRPSLEGHPAPEDILGLSLKDAYFRAAEENDGFAPNQPVFLRFSETIDRKTLCLDEGSKYPDDGQTYCATPGEATAFLVNVDADSPGYKERVPVQVAYGAAASQYICQNWLGASPLDGRPLRHATTYAFVVTTGLKNKRGEAPIRDRDFAKIMSGETAAPELQPLKDWITAAGVDEKTVSFATVFTVGDPTRHAKNLRAAVRQGPEPTFGPHVHCNGANRSPCDDGLTGAAHQRGCFFNAADTFDVIDGTYQAKAFQNGTRPYKTTADGGAIDWGTGIPNAAATETMCFAAAMPKTPPPPGGFPVVIYGHGTGGNYRGFVLDQTAKKLTDLGYAVVSFDNVMHGPRQQPIGQAADPSKWKFAGDFFFNLANARASRDNIHQGTADLFHLVRVLKNTGTTLTRTTGTVRFDASKVMYYGHSQGTIISPEFLATETDLATGLMSGAGAELALSILNKKSPVDASAAAGVFFGDRNLTRVHPMMGIFAMIFAESDSISYAHLWAKNPTLRDGHALPTFHVLGIGDTFTPDPAQNAQLRSSGFPLVGSVDVPVDGVRAVASPLSNNLSGVTAGAIQATPDGRYDGHFVGYSHPVVVNAIRHWFSTAKAGAPEIAK